MPFILVRFHIFQNKTDSSQNETTVKAHTPQQWHRREIWISMFFSQTCMWERKQTLLKNEWLYRRATSKWRVTATHHRLYRNDFSLTVEWACGSSLWLRIKSSTISFSNGARPNMTKINDRTSHSYSSIMQELWTNVLIASPKNKANHSIWPCLIVGLATIMA